MTSIGGPRPDPKNWEEPIPSWIEEEFKDALGDLADECEIERFFGDDKQKSRYRVDFLFPKTRLAVELDGYEWHHTREQLTNDALRQRYLIRAGYYVARFTGREIWRDVNECVRQIRMIYEEQKRRAPAKYRAFFVDVPFVNSEIRKAINFQKSIGVKVDRVPTLPEVLLSGMEALHERSFTTCYLFSPREDVSEIQGLDLETREFDKGEVRFAVQCDDLYIADLAFSLDSHAHLFDDFYLAGDDLAYIGPLSDLSLSRTCKILRKGNDETSMISENLQIPWQNIYYPICTTMGVDP